jgi:hypothetical protein
MGALIGIVFQLIFLAISLMITLALWTVRLTMMLFGLAIAAVSSRRR